MKSKKNSINFFILFLICLGCLFSYKIFNNIQHFPNSYTHTDWLIHYHDGYIRRGLLGYIVIKFEDIFSIQAKLSIFYIQTIIYILYLFLIFKLFKKFEFNIFFLSFLLFPLFIIYPIYENEVLGRKEIFFLVSFQFFLTILDKLKKNNCFVLILFIIFLNSLIHEAIVFYSFFFINIFFINYNFIKKEKYFYLFIYFLIIFLIVILSLFFNDQNSVNIMIENLNLKYGLSAGSGALSWLSKDIFQQIILYNDNLNISHIIRFLLVLIISISPFYLFFLRNRKRYNFLNFNINLLINLFFLIILIIITLDWYRFFYIFFNFFLFSILHQSRNDKDLINNFFICIRSYLKKNYFFIFFIVIFFYSWSPKLLFSDDIGSFPVLRIISKLF